MTPTIKELVELNHHDARARPHVPGRLRRAFYQRFGGDGTGMIDTESDPGSWADAIAHSHCLRMEEYQG